MKAFTYRIHFGEIHFGEIHFGRVHLFKTMYISLLNTKYINK